MRRSKTMTLVSPILLVGMCGFASADPIKITITKYTDAAFTTVGASWSVDAFGNSGVFSNSSAGLSDPFLGTPVSWKVSADANVPGGVTEGYLDTTTLDVTASGGPFYLGIEVDAGDYTHPNLSRVADVAFGASAVVNGAEVTRTASYNGGTLYSFFDATTAAAQSHTGLPVIGPLTLGAYRLGHEYLVKLVGADSRVNVNISTLIVGTSSGPHVPEPWNVVSVIAMAVPVGLLYLGVRRKKSV